MSNVYSAGPPAVAEDPEAPPPVFDADYPGQQRRSQLFLRILVFVPHYIILAALNSAVIITTSLVWIAIMFTGRRPRGLFDFGALYLRWFARVAAYMLLVSDQYPPFGDGPYPAQFVVLYSARSSRLTTYFRFVLAFPSFVALMLLAYVVQAVVIMAWFVILVRGRYPLGLYLFAVGWLRWWLRLSAYLMLLTDHYPPFQLSEAPDPAQLPLAEGAV